MKIARVDNIKESRDGSQRVVAVTSTNIGVNKKGEWIGTPVTVERCVKDLVLVDEALNDSTLTPEISTPAGEDPSEIEDSANTAGIETYSAQDDSTLTPEVNNTSPEIKDSVNTTGIETSSAQDDSTLTP